MKQIYLDNASTSFPKPECVPKAMYEYMTELGCNINRGCYDNAYSVEEKIYETRQLIADMFGAKDCKNVVFTKNITESLNIIIKGFLKSGDHVLVSSMEHNSVMRPLTQLVDAGISFSRIPCNEKGELQLHTLPSLIKPNTRAIILTHASNICGTIMPIKEVGDFCQKNSIEFIVDSAQTAGIVEINMQEMNISALAFTGHKGLLGPQGVGGFILSDEMIMKVEPLISGGTGSLSHTEDIPSFMPDRFEAGTLNIPGVIGLNAALLWINNNESGSLFSHELLLANQFIKGIEPLEEKGLIKIIGLKNSNLRTGVVSILPLNIDPAELAYSLDSKYKIMTRVGLHCAPNAHKTVGTYPTGTLRFSFGYANDLSDVNAAVEAVTEIINGF